MEVCLDVLLEGHVFGVPQVGVRLGLALFEDQLPVSIPEGAFHGDLGVAKVRGVKNLADVALHKVAVQAGDFRDGAFRDVVALVAQGLAPLFVQAAGVDELHLARAAGAGLLVGEQPDIGGNAGIVKDVVGQGDDGFQQVVFQDVFADFGGAAACVAGEEGRAVVNDGNAAAAVLGLLHFGNGRKQEEHLPVAGRGQAGAEPPRKAELGLLLHGGLFVFPLPTEGGIGEDIVKGLPGKLVVGEGVAVLDEVGVVALDEHIRLADGEGLVVDLLPEGHQLRGGVELVEIFLRHGEHAAGAAGRVYVPADFDTKEKALSGVKAAEKGLKIGLPRSFADFVSPCFICSIVLLPLGNVLRCQPCGVVILE